MACTWTGLHARRLNASKLSVAVSQFHSPDMMLAAAFSEYEGVLRTLLAHGWPLVIVLVCHSAVAEKIEIFPAAATGLIDELHDNDEILHSGSFDLVSNFRGKIHGGKIHQDEQTVRLELRPAELELMKLRKRSCW